MVYIQLIEEKPYYETIDLIDKWEPIRNRLYSSVHENQSEDKQMCEIGNQSAWRVHRYCCSSANEISVFGE